MERKIKIKWTLNFYYDNYSTPFTDEINIFQELKVNDYGVLNVRHWDEDKSKFDEVSDFCQGTSPCFAATIPNYADMKLIVNITPNLSTINNLEESEVWVGGELTQLTTNKVTDQDEDYYTNGASKFADFCIDTSKLLISSYQISAIAKKVV